MTSKLEEPFHRQKPSSPGSETHLIEQVMERVRQDKAAYYNRQPELLVEAVRKIAEDFPDIIASCGKLYFMAFTAGVLAERHGISIAAANRAVSLWSGKE